MPQNEKKKLTPELQQLHDDIDKLDISNEQKKELKGNTDRRQVYANMIIRELNKLDYGLSSGSEYNAHIHSNVKSKFETFLEHWEETLTNENLESDDPNVRKAAAKEIELEKRIKHILNNIEYHKMVPKKYWGNEWYRNNFEQQIRYIVSKPDTTIATVEIELSQKLNDSAAFEEVRTEEFSRKLVQHIQYWYKPLIENHMVRTRRNYVTEKEAKQPITEIDFSKKTPAQVYAEMFDYRKQHFPETLKEPTRGQLLLDYILARGVSSITFLEAFLLIGGKILDPKIPELKTFKEFNDWRRNRDVYPKYVTHLMHRLKKEAYCISVPVETGHLQRFKIQKDKVHPKQ